MHVLLFTDVLYVAKKQSGRAPHNVVYKLKSAMRLGTALVNEARIKRHPYAFEIADVDSKTKYVIAFDSLEEKILW